MPSRRHQCEVCKNPILGVPTQSCGRHGFFACQTCNSPCIHCAKGRGSFRAAATTSASAIAAAGQGGRFSKTSAAIGVGTNLVSIGYGAYQHRKQSNVSSSQNLPMPSVTDAHSQIPVSRAQPQQNQSQPFLPQFATANGGLVPGQSAGMGSPFFGNPAPNPGSGNFLYRQDIVYLTGQDAVNEASRGQSRHNTN